MNPEKELLDTTGWKILTLNTKESYFRDIVSGVQKKEHRKLKFSTLNKYTYVEDGKRWLKKFDAIRFQVGYHRDRESALVEIVDAVYDAKKQVVTGTLGLLNF